MKTIFIDQGSELLNLDFINNKDHGEFMASDIYILFNNNIQIIKKDSLRNGDIIYLQNCSVPDYFYVDGMFHALKPTHIDLSDFISRT